MWRRAKLLLSRQGQPANRQSREQKELRSAKPFDPQLTLDICATNLLLYAIDHLCRLSYLSLLFLETLHSDR